MRLLAHLVQHSGWRVALATFTGLAGGMASAALVAVIGRGVAGHGRLGTMAMIFFALCATILVAKTVSENLVLRGTQDMVLQMRLSLSRRLVATPLRKLQELGKAELLVLLTQDVDNFSQTSRLLPMAFGNVVVITASLGYLAWLSLPLFALFVCFLLIGIGVTKLAERRPMRQLVAVRTQVEVLYGHFRALVEGSKELQLNAARSSFFIEFVIGPAALQFRSAVVRAMTGYNWVVNSSNALFYAVIGLTEFIVPLWTPLSTEVRLGSVVIVLYLVQPVGMLLAALPSLRQAGISFQRLSQLRDSLEISAGSMPASHNPFGSVSVAPRIILHQVCYRASSERDEDGFVLGPLDIAFAPGEVVFVVGGNGSGKTTLAMILLGLFEPDFGWIEMDGVAVNSANLAYYRAHFSAVFYDFHLFEQLLGQDTKQTAERAQHHIAAFGLAHKVEARNGRFSTIALSSGQRRRLALVHAYIEDRPVNLFDELAADQGPGFRHVFYTQMLGDLKRKGKTVIVITHDESYFGYADQIIRLNRGRQFTPFSGCAVSEAAK